MTAAPKNIANSSTIDLWSKHGLALAAITILIALEFHSALVAAVNVWIVSPTYSHCFLILPIVAWLVWEKWGVLQNVRPAVAPRFLWLIPILLVVWWLGELSAINEVRQYAVIGLLQVAVITLLGPDVVRVIWFPVLFLLFLVPTGEYLIAPMQHFATRFVDLSLNLLGVPHYTEGTTFELTNGRFEIAEACAGLRFLIATVTLGVLFSYLMYRKTAKILLFLAAAVVVPLIGNGLRCVGIILLAHFTNNKFGAGADHVVYGWGFNVAILVILIVVGALFRDDQQDQQHRLAKPEHRGRPSLLFVGVATAMLISAGPAIALWRESQMAFFNDAALTAYLEGRGWRTGNDNGPWVPYFPGADMKQLMFQEPSAGKRVDLFVGYYARPRAGHTMTAHLNIPWNREGWILSSNGTLNASLGSQPLALEESVINSNREKRLVWSVYWLDDNFTTHLLSVKLWQARAALEGREGQAFIALSTPIEGPVEEARNRLEQSLGPLGQLSQVLDRVATSAQGTH